MKGAIILVLSNLACLCLVTLVQCYPHQPNFLKAQSLKGFDLNMANNHEDLLEEEDQSSPDYDCGDEGGKETDKIPALAGQPNKVNFDQFSGYVTVDRKAGRSLFYYFAESENPSTKPLVLWLNGVMFAPGWSSLGLGAFAELGPFRVNKDGKTLSHNQYAWNRVANILFLESPAGVGFSYSNTSSDYHTAGDRKTAKDSYAFLINWLKRFPEYKTREFFIAGESYGGHYVPQLAKLILHNNKKPNQTVINLKAIVIGNGYVDIETHYKGHLDFYWAQNLLSDEIYHGMVSNCHFSLNGMDRDSDACEKYARKAYLVTISINPYDIYGPRCNSSETEDWKLGFDPCTSNYVNSYLNIPEVQKRLHANTTGIPGPWGLFNLGLNLNWKDSPNTVLPTIKKLIASGIPVWMYSGDADGYNPVTTTKYAIQKLGLSVKVPWYPWYNQGQVGGYVEGYENLTFVTIRGAGHFVPSDQPARALAIFSSFLKGKLP